MISHIMLTHYGIVPVFQTDKFDMHAFFCTTWHRLARDTPKCQWHLSVSGWWLVWSCGVVKGTPTMAQLNDSAPRHYRNQYWVIVNWTLGNKLQWNFNQNTKPVVHDNASQNIACEMVAISARPQCVYRGWVRVNFTGKLTVRNVTVLAVRNVLANLTLSSSYFIIMCLISM